MVANREVRRTAIYLAIVVLLLGVFVYLPMIIASPSDIDSGLNNFVHALAVSGTALVLAEAISGRNKREASAG
jgi:hypothetical protein